MSASSPSPEPDVSAPADDTSAAPAAGGGGLRRLVFSVGLTVGLLYLLEGVASCTVAYRDATRVEGAAEEAHCRYDADLGWSHIPSTSRTDLYGPGRSLTVNAQGVRAGEEYAAAVPEGTYRVICLGDSFTLGYGVDDTETYPARLAELGGVQTVNMGQGGYGVDQAYLWYKRDGVQLDCDLLLFAFIAPDFARMNAPRFIGYEKPFLRVADGELQVENVPVPETYESRTRSKAIADFVQNLGLTKLTVRSLRRVGVLERPAEPEDPLAFDEDVARYVFDDLARLSRERGQEFALVYLPLNRLIDSEPNTVTRFLHTYAEESGVPLIELTDDFANVPAARFPRLFQPDNHYTAEGNELAAQALLRRLRARFPQFPR